MIPDTTTEQEVTEAETTNTTDARTLSDLTGFQRDLLRAIAALDEPSGSAVQDAIAASYGEEIYHGRLYPNLQTLDKKGLVRKGWTDGRTTSYTLTPRGRRELAAHRRWMCSTWGEM